VGVAAEEEVVDEGPIVTEPDVCATDRDSTDVALTLDVVEGVVMGSGMLSPLTTFLALAPARWNDESLEGNLKCILLYMCVCSAL